MIEHSIQCSITIPLSENRHIENSDHYREIRDEGENFSSSWIRTRDLAIHFRVHVHARCGVGATDASGSSFPAISAPWKVARW